MGSEPWPRQPAADTVLHTLTARRTLAAGVVVVAGLLGLACSSSDPEDPTAFCEAMTDASAPDSPISTLEIDDPVILENALADLDAMAEVAPEEVAEATADVATVYRDLLTSLAGTAPGARADVLRDFQVALDETANAAAAVQAYGRDTCGLKLEGPAQPTPTPTPLDIDD